MRFHHGVVIAATLTPPPTTIESGKENESTEEVERAIEERLSENPSDDALRALMELKIRERHIDGAIGVIDRLIEIGPEEIEWPLLKANMYIYNDDHESAKKLFEEMMKQDPL